VIGLFARYQGIATSLFWNRVSGSRNQRNASITVAVFAYLNHPDDVARLTISE